MTKNGFRILVEQDLDGSVDGALAELIYRGELPEGIYSSATMCQRVAPLLENGEYERVIAITTALKNDDVKFFRQDDSYAEVIPVKSIDDVLDLFEDDNEMSLEKVREWICNNDVEITELYDKGDVMDFVRNNINDISPDDLFDDDTLTQWTKDNVSLDDMYDCDEIMDWVRDNVDIDEVTSLDWRY